MGMSKIEKLTWTVLVVVLMVESAPGGEAAISCSSVISYIESCVAYVTNKGPIGVCCGGVRGLHAAAKTKDERQSACKCLKTVAASLYPNLDLDKVAALPATCGVTLPYKISPSTDCTKVN